MLRNNKVTPSAFASEVYHGSIIALVVTQRTGHEDQIVVGARRSLQLLVEDELEIVSIASVHGLGSFLRHRVLHCLRPREHRLFHGGSSPHFPNGGSE